MKLDRDNLIRARERLGYSIETVAEEAGIAKNSVLRAEHGEENRRSARRNRRGPLRGGWLPKRERAAVA